MSTVLRYFSKLITLQLPLYYYALFLIGFGIIFFLFKYRFKKGQAFALLVALFVSVIAMAIPSLFYKDSTITFTVFIHGSGGRQDALTNVGGKISIDLGNKREVRDIGKDGSTSFLEIPVVFKNKPITILIQYPGYEMASPTGYILSDTPVYIMLKKNIATGTINGVVKDAAKGLPLSGATIYVADTAVITKETGEFSFVLPEKKWVSTEMGYYQLVIKKTGYKSVTEKYYPGANVVTIQMNRQK